MSTALCPKNSTNVRSEIPAWLRLGMSGLDAIAPPLATRVAERLLLTPMRHATPARERAVRERARLLTLPWWPKGRTLVGYEWGAGAPILLVHGWAGRATQLGSFVAPLVAAGHSVLAFDLPAHGRSDGESASLFEFRDALVEIGRRHGPFVGVIAHSMGAAATCMALAAGLDARRVVSIASPASLVEQTRRTLEQLGLSDDAFTRLSERLENRFRAKMASVEVEAIGPSLDVGALVIHDDGDAEVAPEDAARIARAMPRARLLRTQGLGHRRILRDPGVVSAAAEFLTGCAADLDPTALDQGLERELFERERRRGPRAR